MRFAYGFSVSSCGAIQHAFAKPRSRLDASRIRFRLKVAAIRQESPIVLITGANRGIGRQAARLLAERDCEVVVSGRNTEAVAQAADHLHRETGRGVTSLALDVTDPGSITAAAETFGQLYTHLDVLINNAGVFAQEDTDILEVDPATFQNTLSTNTLGPILTTQAFLPWLRRATAGGRVINLSSGLGQLTSMEADAPSYSISKTALNAVTRQLAHTLRPERIAVNSVCPGWVRTRMGGPNAPRSEEEGASTVVWLATEAPQSLTGKFLRDRQEIDW